MARIRSFQPYIPSVLLILLLCATIKRTEGFATNQIEQRSLVQHHAIDSRRFESPNGQTDMRRKRQGRPNNQRGNWQQNSYKGKGRASNPNSVLNGNIAKQPNAASVLQVLAGTKGALTTIAGGNMLNSINFSTAMHRVGRHVAWSWQNPEGNDRSKILADPRFALLIASAGEALGGADVVDQTGRPLVFGNRELSNMSWAIAKLKIAPPSTVSPVDSTINSLDNLNDKCQEVRKLVYETAKNRKQNPNAPNGAWIQALSQLCGYMMDHLSYRMVELNTERFQFQEYSNLIWATATAKRCSPELFKFVLSKLVEKGQITDTEDLKPQEWSNSMWALATSGFYGPELEFIPFVANLLDNNPQFVDEFKPQELANTAWGVATILSKHSGQTDSLVSDAALRIIRQCAMQLIKRNGENHKTQEISNTVWSFATIGFGLKGGSSANAGNDYTFLQSDDMEGDLLLMEDAVKVAASTAKQILHRFRSQELNNLAWAMARLGQKDEELLTMIGNEIASPKRKVTSQDIGTTLWGFASVEFFDDDIYRRILAKVNGRRAHYSKPQELSNVLWALATADVVPKYKDSFDTMLKKQARTPPHIAEVDPVTYVIAIASQELMRRPQEFKTQEIKDILWSLSRLGVRYPPLFKAIALHLVGPANDPEITGRGLEGFSSQGMGNLAWAYAKQARLAAEMSSHRNDDMMIGKMTGRLAYYSASFIDVGESLIQKLFYAIAEADLKVHDNLNNLSPQDVANTVWAFANMGMKHDRFLQKVTEQLESRIQRFVKGDKRGSNFSGQELANTVWALATLNCMRPDLLDSVQDYVMYQTGGNSATIKSVSEKFRRQELGNIAWVCAVVDRYPKKLIEILYLGLLGVGEKSDPKHIQNVFNDGDMDPSIAMCLLYLQANMVMANPDQPFALPKNFPEGWLATGKMSASNARNLDTSNFDNSLASDDSFELALSTSNIQLLIGDAFDRAGFDHVQEHVIGSDNFANEYGIFVTAVATEMLSLDLAQVDSKIGIEVDGPAHYVTKINDGPTRVAVKTSDSCVIRSKDGFKCRFDWSDDDQEINGSSAMKARMLEHLGWRVINVPFWEWYPVRGIAKKEEAYCRSKLADADTVH